MRRSIIGFALLLIVAGCGSDPKADPSPSPSSPVTSPVSTTPSPPVMPDAAKANTKAGAIAFVRHYIDLVNYAQATGDVNALEEVEDHGCKSCEHGQTYLSSIYEAKGHIDGGQWTIRRVTAEKSGENWAVTVSGDFAPSDVFTAPSAAPSHASGGPTLTNFVVWHSNDWKVRTWFSG
jgi:hypothetical protein